MLGMGSLVQGDSVGDHGSIAGLADPGERGAQVHPPRPSLRAGEPGGPADHAGRPRHAPRPNLQLCRAVEASVRLCARPDIELRRKA